MSNVFVIDNSYKPLNPVHPARARLLLKQGKASVYRMYPFTIVLKRTVEHPEVEPLRIKLDPGSKTTGIAIVNDASGKVVFAAELSHRGHKIKKSVDSRRGIRRFRRTRKTRYRQPRLSNRTRKNGWLPPSLESRIFNIVTWVQRISRYTPITAISMELVHFDLQKMGKSDAEYQQGTPIGYEVREFLLEKWHRTCAYCGKGNTPLQIEHIQPRSKGGTDRISNLCLACEKCNIAKGTQDIRVFLKDKPETLKDILSQAKSPLKDASAVNTTRWALYERLKGLKMPIECGSGGLTKFNRTQRQLPKTHWIDAANVGKTTPRTLTIKNILPLLITATGHGSRQMCQMNKFGFPRAKAKGSKTNNGFQTGDFVKVVMTTGKRQGTYIGRVVIRSTGSFRVITKTKTIHGISHRFCQTLHHNDGYSYTH